MVLGSGFYIVWIMIRLGFKMAEARLIILVMNLTFSLFHSVFSATKCKVVEFPLVFLYMITFRY